jgi:hypothetical protein
MVESFSHEVTLAKAYGEQEGKIAAAEPAARIGSRDARGWQ